MESALRSAYYLLTGKDLTHLDFEDVRGMAGVKEAPITIGDRRPRWRWPTGFRTRARSRSE